jgi:hypothetical protein
MALAATATGHADGLMWRPQTLAMAGTLMVGLLLLLPRALRPLVGRPGRDARPLTVTWPSSGRRGPIGMVLIVERSTPA